jgi:CheY-like chemotaxis protein
MTDATAETQEMTAARLTDRPSVVFPADGSVRDSDADVHRFPPGPPEKRIAVPTEALDRFFYELQHLRADREQREERDVAERNTQIAIRSIQEQIGDALSGITALLFRGQPPAPTHELLGRRILVVEDFVPLAQALDRTLEGMGAKVTLRGCYFDALQWLLEKRDLEIAVLDIRLGDGDGIKLAQRILDEYPRCAIVLVTGAPIEDYQHRAASVRAKLLRKPHSHEQLLEAILGQIETVAP